MVTYLRNNQAVSWLGVEPAMRRSQIQRPNHYITEPKFSFDDFGFAEQSDTDG